VGHVSLVSRCDADKIHALHAYLDAQFPGCTLHHFRTPTTVIHADKLVRRTHHHVVRITAGEIVAHAVVLEEFWEQSVAEIEEWLRESDLADMLRAHPIVILSEDEAYAL